MTRLQALLLHAGGLLLSAAVHAAPEHALTLYGEPPKYPANFTHFDYTNPDAPKGGTLRQAGVGGFDSLNPFITKGNPADVSLIYDTLAQQSLDEPFAEYGLVAEKIEKAPDNSWVRFYLRPQARFHDGHPIRAEDVVFSFDTLTTKGAPLYRHYYGDVAEVVAETPLKVLFRFKHTNNRELPLILGQLPVLPKHYWKDRDFTRGNLDIPLGSGPYKVASVDPGRSITLERVDNYWGKDLAVNRGFYNFQRVVTDYYRDYTVALEALKAGQYDVRQEMIAKNWASAYNVPAVRDGRLVREEIHHGNSAGMQGFVFNLRRAKFQDVRVRKAIGLLFDFEWTNRQLFNGAYTRSNSYFTNSEMAASGLPDAAQLKILEPLRGQIPDTVFTEAFANPVTDGSGQIRPQMREAYKLLTDAGYHVENDRMVDAKGQPLSIEFLLFQTDFERVLLPFKRNLAELGIDFTIRRVDASQYINRIRDRDYDMVVGNWPQSPSPGNEQREFWSSAAADNPGSRALMGLKDPAIDQLVEQLIKADTRQSLLDHTRALDRVLLNGYYVIPNWYIDTWRMAYWNHLAHPKVSPRYDVGLMTWWVKPDSAPATPAKEP